MAWTASPMMTLFKPWLALAGWLLLCFSAAAFGAQFMPGAWYASLRKPDWNPPGWVFGPVWTTLYTMMAVAAWRVWRRDGVGRRPALAWFLGQLLLNALWSWLFFGLRNPGLALAEIIALWVAIAGTIGHFRRLDRVAAGLLVPYLAWVSFAAVLNGTLWWLNR